MIRTKFTVIVLNFNSLSLLQNCLEALQRAVDVYAEQVDVESEIVVVDNASAESPRAFLQQAFPTVQLIENPSNRGFGAGNNVAIQQGDATFVVLINPDVVVAPDFFAHLLTPFADPTVGIVGSKLHYPAGNIIQHAGGYLISPRALPSHFGIGELDSGQHDRAREVEYVIGAAIALRRAMLDEIGLFDEEFFLLFEEVDLCFRAHAAGWKVWYEPSAVATHIESAIIGKRSFFYYQQFHKSRMRFVTKHFSEDEILALVSAEIPHLAKLSHLERLALQLAYQHILATSDAEFITDQMHRLLAAAVQPADAPILPSAEITPLPFHSKWPLMARLRDLWSRVAVRPLAQAQFAQQSAFNRAVTLKIVENDRLIEAQRGEIARLSAEISRNKN